MSRQFFEAPIANTQGLQACPLCGSDSGFYYKFADVTIQFVDWEGYPIEANNDEPLYRRKARCMNCNKVVEKFINEGEAPEPVEGKQV